MCIHDGSPLEDEDPYSYCAVGCSACKRVAPFTERNYTSDFGVSTKSGGYYNLGSHCSVTACCHGAVCFCCAFRSEIFCKFCDQQTTVLFLDKNYSRRFSQRTESGSITDWFDLICSFDRLKEDLGRNCQLFFVWLRKHYKGCDWNPENYSWHHLDLDNRITKTLICEFEKFLLAIASKMVVSLTFFSRNHQIAMINPPFFAEINSRRQHLLPAFLEACYSRLPITRRQMMKQSQVAIVGTLAVRLSHYQKQKQFAKIIFSRIMLNLLLLKN